ncbi:beta-3 adrenergic receptor-like [Patiria miniata]|uniref:G-protein coupled receptors family 1 profile domain-containing protein n=1 Tax=Patiria miniata TaxID=46514 RepID=A0A914BMN8_PATMI|nr:beta-3 adrenergic receptor-like [Patiria miniata]
MSHNAINSTVSFDFDLALPHNAFSIIGCIWMTLTVILILTFTPISLVVIYQVPSIQQTTKLFMTSLTVADLGNGLFWALPKLTENIAGSWVLGDGMCKMYGVGYRTFVSLSVFSLVLLNIDRYIAIVYSLQYFRIVTVKRTKIVIAVTWVVSFTSGVSAFGFVIYRVVSATPPHLCVWKEDGLHQLAVVSILFTSLVIMLGLYAHILVIARRQARRIASETQPLGPRRDNGLRLRLKSATTVFIITGAVSLSWIPQIVIGATDLQTSRETRVFTDTLLMTNSWLNVVIYSFRNRDLRKRLHGTLWSCRRLCSCQREHAVADASN